MPRARAWAALALAGWSRTRPSGVLAQEEGSGECAAEDAVLARFADCLFTDADCLSHLNASSGADLVRTGEVMAAFEKVGRDGLHAGSIKGPEWVERFVAHQCTGAAEQLPFPVSASEADSLRARLRESSATGPQPLLVHVDGTNDGLGARFKKAVEVVAAALQMGFFAVALALPPAGSAVHLADWEHGAVWCHESPAGAPGDPNGERYPLICWRFELQADLLAQSPRPEGRVLLWGAPDGRAPSAPAGTGGASFRCFQFKAQDGQLPDGLAWNFVRREGVSKAARRRLFESVRAFSAPLHQLAGRRESRCGFGGPEEMLHAAMHVRRGDVGDFSSYPVTHLMSKDSFARWLCGLAGQGRQLALHVYTEARGLSREALRESNLSGFLFPPEAGDADAPIFHATGRLEPPAPCDNVLQEVHFVVNNNPREALLCMARADVLVTSFSSLGWAAAVLNGGTVYHPNPKRYQREPTHWDLREQYLDWADNWFLMAGGARALRCAVFALLVPALLAAGDQVP